MDAKTHARLVERFSCSSFIVWPLIGLAFFIVAAREGELVPLLILPVVWVLALQVIWHLPVHCEAPGCGGLMKKTSSGSPKSDYRKLVYRCTVCGQAYMTYSFQGSNDAEPPSVF